MNATLELLKIKATLSLNKKGDRIEENEVIDLLGNEFPLINNNFEKISNPTNVYKSTQCFADFTKQLIKKRNFKEVKHCYRIAENILKRGSATVKNAIENVYLFSLSSILDQTGPLSQRAKELLPKSLKKEYYRQINASGI